MKRNSDQLFQTEEYASAKTLTGPRKERLFGNLLLVILLAAAVMFSLRPMSAAAATYTLQVSQGQDIAPVIQPLLDQAKSGEQVTITIPAGSYTLGNSLNVYSNTTLLMDGVTLHRINGIDTMVRLGRGTEPNGGYYYHDVTFQGGTWDGSGTNKDLLRIAHAQNILIKGVSFQNVQECHHIEIAACRNVTFDGCTVSGFIGKPGERHEALQIDILHQNHFQNYPPYDGTICSDITIQNCTFKGLQAGIGSHSAVIGSYFNNIRFLNNTFEDITAYAIIMMNYTNSVVRGNTLNNCGSGIIYRAMNPDDRAFYGQENGQGLSAAKNLNNVIENNTINIVYDGYSNMAEGISLYGEVVGADRLTNAEGAEGPIQGTILKGDYRVKGITVQNNKITLNCKGLAICLEGADENIVRKNTITCSITKKGANKGTGDGIRLVNSDKNRIEDNTITNKKWTGNAKAMNGISLIKGTKKDNLSGSDSNTVKGNKITNASMHGISVQESSKNTLQSNTITGTKTTNGNGIYVFGADGTKITRNTVKNTKSHGIQAKASSSVTIKTNTVKTTSGENSCGIMVQEKANKATISGNTISGAKSCGIMVQEKAVEAVISGNTISGAKNCGILVQEKANKAAISGNTISGAKTDGIRVAGSSKSVTVKSNRISNSGRFGLLVMSNSSVKASGNTIKGSGQGKSATAKGGKITGKVS